MWTASGIVQAFALLSFVTLGSAGCSGVAVGTGSPDAGDPPEPSSADPAPQDPGVAADGGTSSSDASDASPAPAPGKVTVFLDGKAGKPLNTYAVAQKDGIQTDIRFQTTSFNEATVMIAIKLAGAGCSLESGNSLGFIDWSAGSDNFFQPEAPATVCGLVVTSVGTRVVGSFQGNVVNNGSPVTKHAVAVSFDLPVQTN